VFKNAQGKSKSRLDRNSEQKKTTMSRTMLVVASNLSIAERVYNNTETTEAGGLRVFEIESLPLSSSIAASKSETLILKLNDNYGCAGAVYADFIARNRPAIEQIIAQISDDLEKAWHFGIKERFWKNTMVTILAGANLANAAGLTTFNIQAIETCLIKSLEDLRINLSNQPHTLAGAQAGEGVLGELIASLQGKSVIHTNIIPLSTMGRPASGTVKAMAFTDPGKLSDVWMQVGNDGRILIARKSFRHWLKSRNYQSELHIIKLLSQDYIIVQSKATIGAGLEFMEVLKARVYCWDMTRRVPLPPSHTPSSPSSSFGSLVQ
jgi:hypothetical protein